MNKKHQLSNYGIKFNFSQLGFQSEFKPLNNSKSKFVCIESNSVTGPLIFVNEFDDDESYFFK